jgi:hypothetical protein
MIRAITKTIDVEGRTFVVKKYPAMDGLKIAKTLVAKILPMFQSFVPLISESRKEGGADINKLSNLENYLSLDSIAATLDKILPADFDYIMQKSLQNVCEMLPAGEAQVLNSDGTYGVLNVEHDPLLVLRLVCEVVLWGVGDFFDGNRLASIMSPLSSSLPSSR